MHLAISSCLVFAMLFAASVSGGEPLVGSRLRCLDPLASRLVAEAKTWSPSVRQLIGRIELSDLIVFVRVQEISARHAAETRFISSAPGVRYLMVRVDSRIGPPDMMALFGHELQHVKEIADAPAVQVGADVAALFERIGWPSSTPNGFETAAAIEVGRMVAQEVRGAHPLG